jgi:hypothetical protein
MAQVVNRIIANEVELPPPFDAALEYTVLCEAVRSQVESLKFRKNADLPSIHHRHDVGDGVLTTSFDRNVAANLLETLSAEKLHTSCDVKILASLPKILQSIFVLVDHRATAYS